MRQELLNKPPDELTRPELLEIMDELEKLREAIKKRRVELKAETGS